MRSDSFCAVRQILCGPHKFVRFDNFLCGPTDFVRPENNRTVHARVTEVAVVSSTLEKDRQARTLVAFPVCSR